MYVNKYKNGDCLTHLCTNALQHSNKSKCWLFSTTLEKSENKNQLVLDGFTYTCSCVINTAALGLYKYSTACIESYACPFLLNNFGLDLYIYLRNNQYFWHRYTFLFIQYLVAGRLVVGTMLPLNPWLWTCMGFDLSIYIYVYIYILREREIHLFIYIYLRNNPYWLHWMYAFYYLPTTHLTTCSFKKTPVWYKLMCS